MRLYSVIFTYYLSYAYLLTCWNAVPPVFLPGDLGHPLVEEILTLVLVWYSIFSQGKLSSDLEEFVVGVI